MALGLQAPGEGQSTSGSSGSSPAPIPVVAVPRQERPSEGGQPTTAQPPPANQPAPVTQGAQQVTVVQVVEPPTRETSVGDILLGSVGFVGFVLLAALLVGLLAGGLFIAMKRLRPGNTFNGQNADESSLKLNSLDG